MKEIWKDIKDYEQLYVVSNTGKIKSLARKNTNGGILKPSHNKDGYLQVILCKNGKTKCFKCHRLVAEQFIPNLNNKPEVNHIDGNKENNDISNLEWVTTSENVIHAFKKELRVSNFIKYNQSKKVMSQI